MLLPHHLLQRLLVPLLHALVTLLAAGATVVAAVAEEVDLGHLALHAQVVGELALEPLLALGGGWGGGGGGRGGWRVCV